MRANKKERNHPIGTLYNIYIKQKSLHYNIKMTLILTHNSIYYKHRAQRKKKKKDQHCND